MLAACGMQAGEHGSSGYGAGHWEYAGEAGPEHWGDLAPEFAACKLGHDQSPIDITGATPNGALLPLMTNYKSTPANLVNTGHTIQVNYVPGSTLFFNGQSYDLLQFHFHEPSEHTINGQRAAMELHLVHRNAAGNFAVVGVLLTAGAENPALNPFWYRLPAHEGKVAMESSINIASLLPTDRHYYTYEGSLTTPPCTEGVRWIVMKTPVELSSAQIGMYAAIFPGSARPVEPRDGRLIEEF